MKIAIDARIINSSTGRYVERLVHYLEELDKNNEYLILVPRKDIDFYQPRNPQFKVIEADFDNYSLAEQAGLLRLLNHLQPDLVHFCMPQQPILYRGKHVTTMHDLNLLNTYNSDKDFIIFHFKQLIGRFVFYVIAHTSVHILTPSQFTKETYVKFARINSKKVTVTYEGCDIGAVKPLMYKPLVNKQFLLYVGQQSDYKNIRRLMQAHQKLRLKHPELLLVLVGRLSGKNGRPLVRNKIWAEGNGFEGIIFTDFVSDANLVWLYKHCATYVFPSLMEGFGLPGLEAMASGAPVTSSNATCLPEVYSDGAYYFDPLSIEDMQRAIDEVITDDTLRKRLTNNGQQVAKRYSWKHMAEQTLAVYKNSLE